MYCHHCGADEPEIRIGDRAFCSICGLPLEKTEDTNASVSDAPTPNQENKSAELDRVFESMSGNLEGRGQETSYKSSDVNLLGTAISATPASTVKVTVLEENSISAPPEETQAKSDVPTLVNIEVEEEPILENVQTDESPAKNETSFDKILEELNKINETGPDIPEEIFQAPESALKLKETTGDETKEKGEEPPNSKMDEANTAASPDEKEIKNLGAASKLLDILEKKESAKEKYAEKAKLTRTLQGAEKLMDILKDLPEKKKAAVPYEEKQSLKLDAATELKSPLDTKEIELDKDDFERSKATEPNASLAGKDETEENKTLPDLTEVFKNHQFEDEGAVEIKEALDLSAEIDEKTDTADAVVASQPPKDPVDIVTEWQNEEEPFLEDIAENQPEETEDAPQTTDTEEISGEAEDATQATGPEEVLEEAAVPEETLEEIAGIHGLGEKKGHIDHWKDEEVKKIVREDDLENKAGEHPLTSFFKDALKTKDAPKQDAPKSKKKKKRPKKTIRVILSFLLSTVLVFGFIYLSYNLPKKDFETEKKKALSRLEFQPLEPTYVPLGFIGISPVKADASSLEITYKHAADPKRQLTLKESFITISEEDLEREYVTKTTGEYTTETVNGYKLYCFKRTAIYKNDNLIIIWASTFDLNPSEFKKIVGSQR